MMKHLITSNTPEQWEATRQKAQSMIPYDLTTYTPHFVKWNDLVMLQGKEQADMANILSALIKEGRKQGKIVVIHARNAESVTKPESSSPSLSSLKETIRKNGIVLS